MDAIDRIKELVEAEGITRDELANKTGIGYKRWTNVISYHSKLRHEEVEAIGEAWPEYKVWIATGTTFPSEGQISPSSKAADRGYDKKE